MEFFYDYKLGACVDRYRPTYLISSFLRSPNVLSTYYLYLVKRLCGCMYLLTADRWCLPYQAVLIGLAPGPPPPPPPQPPFLVQQQWPVPLVVKKLRETPLRHERNPSQGGLFILLDAVPTEHSVGRWYCGA